MDFCISVQEMQDAIVYLKPVLNRGSDELSNLLMVEADSDGVTLAPQTLLLPLRLKLPR